MKYAWIETNRYRWPVSLSCEVLGVSASGYHQRKVREPIDPTRPRRTVSNDALLVHMRAIHAASRSEYGWPRVWKELLVRGIRVGKERVRKLMQQHGIRAKTKRKFRVTTDSNHDLPIAPNRLMRDFSPPQPDQAWAGDITCIWTDEGWLYLAAVVDLYSRQVVGWSMKPQMKADLVLDALRMAWFRRHPKKGLIFHSDRGSQYCALVYRDALGQYGMLSSMSRKGDCWDNAVVESLWGSLKVARIHGNRFATRRAAMDEVIDWFGFYNRYRLHSTLGYVSPMSYEQAWHAEQGKRAA